MSIIPEEESIQEEILSVGEIMEEDVKLPETDLDPEQKEGTDVEGECGEDEDVLKPWWRFGEKWLQFGTRSYQVS